MVYICQNAWVIKRMFRCWAWDCNAPQVGFALVICQALQPVILDLNTEDSTRREVNRALVAMAGDVATLGQ